MNLFKLGITLLSFALAIPTHAAAPSIMEATRKAAENQIRNLIEPILDRYCHESCKLMNIRVTVDHDTNQDSSPGFDDDIKTIPEYAPTSGVIKVLIDDKIGPVSRGKLHDLLQQFLDTLDFPVKIDEQSAHFPMPQGSEVKIAELRNKIAKDFQDKTEALLREYCQSHCLLSDFNLQTNVVNGEEAQYNSPGEILQEGDTAIRIKEISATLLMDDVLPQEEQDNLLEMVRLKTSYYKHVTITGKSIKFPSISSKGGTNGLANGHGNGEVNREISSIREGKTSSESSKNESSKLESKNETNSKSSNDSNSKSTTDSSSNTKSNNEMNSSDTRVEKLQRIERIEKVENGDIVLAELQKLKFPVLLFACSVLSLLIFIAATTFKRASSPAPTSSVERVLQTLTSDPTQAQAPQPQSASTSSSASPKETNHSALSKRYEIERLAEELSSIYAQQPKVAKQVFSRILTEEGVEVTADCIHIFGESIIIEMLRDPTLQTDLNELMEYYAKNPIELSDEDRLELLRKLHSRTVAGKLVVLGNRSSNLFDFLNEMDGLQILELIRTETLTVKAIVMTQCDAQKRSTIYNQMDADLRMKVLTELSRIDYLPRNYIFNVAAALKRKKKENPKLNTEALPGSEILVGLLERTGHTIQQQILQTLEVSNPDSARTVKNKLVSTDTLKYLRDGQLLEVVLSLKHEELIPFLKGVPNDVREAIYAKSPKDLVSELEEELALAPVFSREAYQNIERKVLNRMKVMANEGLINLLETNERMFADHPADVSYIPEKAS